MAGEATVWVLTFLSAMSPPEDMWDPIAVYPTEAAADAGEDAHKADPRYGDGYYGIYEVPVQPGALPSMPGPQTSRDTIYR